MVEMLERIRRDAWWRPVFVLIVMALMVRLGLWQLDRLEQRRARNEEIRTQINALPLNLNTDPLPDDLNAFKYRTLEARGRFDFEHQFALKNRSWQGRPGVDLITPLILEGKDVALLVDRGWIPYEKASPQEWEAFNSPQGVVTVMGVVGLAAIPPTRVPRPITPDPAEKSVFYIDPPSLESVLPYRLLPFYLVWVPEDEGTSDQLPFRYAPQYDLSEGPHLGYAIQWFLFAAAAPGVYLYLLSRREEG